jgi:hypothetical protein
MSVRPIIGAIIGAMLASEAHAQGLVPETTDSKEKAPLHRELHVLVTVDQEVRVYGHLRLARGCGQGPIPDMTVVKPPSIGMLAVRIENVTLTQPDFGSCGAGHIGMGRVVYYRAASAGTDAFQYQMSSPGLPTTTWSVTVEIR